MNNWSFESVLKAPLTYKYILKESSLCVKTHSEEGDTSPPGLLTSQPASSCQKTNSKALSSLLDLQSCSPGLSFLWESSSRLLSLITSAYKPGTNPAGVSPSSNQSWRLTPSVSPSAVRTIAHPVPCLCACVRVCARLTGNETIAPRLKGQGEEGMRGQQRTGKEEERAERRCSNLSLCPSVLTIKHIRILYVDRFLFQIEKRKQQNIKLGFRL